MGVCWLIGTPLHQEWKYVVNAVKGCLIDHSTENGIFKVFPRLQAAQTLTTTIYTISFHRPYLLVVPVTISAQTRDMFEISGVLAGRVAQPSISGPNFPHFSSIHTNIDCLHPRMLKSSLGDYQFPPNIERFQRYLQWGKLALLASDGSLADDKSATQGWKLHSRIDQEAQANGHVYVVGGGAVMSSLRLETRWVVFWPECWRWMDSFPWTGSTVMVIPPTQRPCLYYTSTIGL